MKMIKTSMLTSVIFSFLWVSGGTALAEEPNLEAESAILVDAETGKIIYDDEIDVILPPASMTKIMTEYLVNEAVKSGKIAWDDEVKISDTVRELSLETNLSNVPLRQDETYTVKELYEAMAIYSANGATIALAEHVAGSEGEFVKLMNEKAKEIGMENYKFVNSTGLNNKSMDGQHPKGTKADEENMMSARATATLAYHLLKEYPETLETTSIRAKTFKEGTEDYIDMQNWNWMLPGSVFAYEGVDGLKTGYTDMAGNAFTGTAERDGMRFISVVMRTDSREARFKETAKLLDYGFDTFTYEKVIEKGESVKGKKALPVSKGKEDAVTVAAGHTLSVLVEKDQKEKMTPVVTLNKKYFNEDGELIAPLKKGQAVGLITIENDKDDEYLQEEMRENVKVPLVIQEDVEKAGWFSLSLRSIGGFFGEMWSGAASFVKELF
ncbi:D-alanyl-D-alanine carboxypeptidase family protein [Bacillus piscicola]|uniref:D-alanyl-D-alanine carboxypeptidase family protein n=1 Tax=Bacillus piscicola TaxID=1632684 RepID=UPI001F0912F8|nr:D-alanyl-D-alanine carboxypeptidase family protein [Bacillus piscicola]